MNAYLTFKDQVAQRAILNDELRTARSEYDTVQRRLNEIDARGIEYKGRLECVQHRSPHESLTQFSGAKVGPEEVDDIHAELERIAADARDANAERTTLKLRITELETQVKAPLIATVGDYGVMVAHQAEVAAASALASRLGELIADQDRALAAASWDDPRPELARQRADILASMAMGNATAADLEAFDKDTAGRIKAADVKAQQHTAELSGIEATRAGLARKLEATTSDLAKLNTLTPQIRVAILTADLMGAQGDFEAAAAANAAAQRRVFGLVELLRQCKAMIPAPPKMPAPNDPAAAMREERARLIAAGVPV
ncbi:hypothetical protein [uncultured Thiodictyon sp.]|uniref:hypothetical protein n=1 Tax=uncultured Thiodictyon sp. TaxID=1846217 RepID=UPI0025EC733B|nr:hypothetical protein [uncultured Thiodictyon sp.]